MIATKQGKIKKVWWHELRPMGRLAKGLPMIKLDKGDEVLSVQVVVEEAKETK